jgi:hypothetical protein
MWDEQRFNITEWSTEINCGGIIILEIYSIIHFLLFNF